MMPLRNFLLLAALASMLGACSMFNSLTGQVDNTVLPGAREDAIPGRASFPERSDVATTGSSSDPDQTGSTAEPQAACKQGDPGCAPPKGNDTFSDPQ